MSAAEPRSRGGPAPPGRGAAPRTVPERYRYTMDELVEQTDVTARTVRFYVTEGLLAPALGRGPTATYDLGHLLRLKMIVALKAQRLGLREIKERLGELSDEDIQALLGVETTPHQERWRRISLHADIELHVRERNDDGPDLVFEDAIRTIVGHAQPVIDRLEERR